MKKQYEIEIRGYGMRPAYHCIKYGSWDGQSFGLLGRLREDTVARSKPRRRLGRKFCRNSAGEYDALYQMNVYDGRVLVVACWMARHFCENPDWRGRKAAIDGILEAYEAGEHAGGQNYVDPPFRDLTFWEAAVGLPINLVKDVIDFIRDPCMK